MSGNANRAFRLVQALGDDQIGLEARAQAGDHQDVKIWLRLLACCLQIESQVRQHLRRFGTTLPRFDFLAQLDRHPDGLRMTALSHYLMVTGGNVTGLADQLVQEGLVERLDDAEDRRCTRVRLTLATITLNRPERKNPLTFDSYAELRDLFRDLRLDTDIKAVVVTGAGGNFCSGGDVHEIIGPLTRMDMARPARLHAHDRRPGEGHARLPAADRRRGRRRLRRRRRHPRHGLRPAPRHGAQQNRLPVQPRRPGRLRHGRLHHPAAHHRPGPRLRAAVYRPQHERRRSARLGLLQPPVRTGGRAGRGAGAGAELAAGPSFAHGMTKAMLHQEWAMGVDEAIEAEAQAQALCMQTQDFRRAYEAFASKQKPVFQGD
jgi:enoyl-CoA hydratase/carnithine racemase